MKKLVPFIVPLVMFCILAGYTGAQVAQADEEVMWTLVSIGDADGSEVDMTTIEGLIAGRGVGLHHAGRFWIPGRVLAGEAYAELSGPVLP
jgi:hypothetical protein